MCSIGVFFFFFSLNNTKYCLLSLLSSSLFSLSQPYSPISPHFSSYRSYFALCVHNCAGCVLFLRVLNVFFLHNSVSYFFFFINSANMTASIFFVSTLLFGGFQSFFFLALQNAPGILYTKLNLFHWWYSSHSRNLNGVCGRVGGGGGWNEAERGNQQINSQQGCRA